MLQLQVKPPTVLSHVISHGLFPPGMHSSISEMAMDTVSRYLTVIFNQILTTLDRTPSWAPLAQPKASCI